MKVNVRLFAAAKDLVGHESISVELPGEATVSDLRLSIASQHSILADLLKHTMIAVNTEYASDQTTLAADDEIACIPPVSGG